MSVLEIRDALTLEERLEAAKQNAFRLSLFDKVAVEVLVSLTLSLAIEDGLAPVCAQSIERQILEG